MLCLRYQSSGMSCHVVWKICVFACVDFSEEPAGFAISLLMYADHDITFKMIQRVFLNTGLIAIECLTLLPVS